MKYNIAAVIAVLVAIIVLVSTPANASFRSELVEDELHHFLLELNEQGMIDLTDVLLSTVDETLKLQDVDADGVSIKELAQLLSTKSDPVSVISEKYQLRPRLAVELGGQSLLQSGLQIQDHWALRPPAANRKREFGPVNLGFLALPFLVTGEEKSAVGIRDLRRMWRDSEEPQMEKEVAVPLLKDTVLITGLSMKKIPDAGPQARVGVEYSIGSTSIGAGYKLINFGNIDEQTGELAAEVSISF